MCIVTAQPADVPLRPAKGYEPFLEWLYNDGDIPAYLQTERGVMRSSIRSLVVETKVPKDKDDLFDQYEGREHVLLRNLEKLMEKQENDAAMVAEIKALAEETKLPKVRR